MVMKSLNGWNITSHEYVPASDFVASLMEYVFCVMNWLFIIVLSFFHMTLLGIFSDILQTISSS